MGEVDGGHREGERYAHELRAEECRPYRSLCYICRVCSVRGSFLRCRYRSGRGSDRPSGIYTYSSGVSGAGGERYRVGRVVG
jgi:hypothetical protein